jgi:toxin ParE1/3/4
VTRVRITPRAARDLDVIALWTLEKWGVERMETYLRALNDRFNWLAENPQSGRKRDDIAKGYRSFPEGRHMIFYIEAEGAVAIIGVPHQSMDSSGYFG